ncbi:MAG TPA: DUF1878 family protein [Bacillus bacterium]|nr:DUF1878 family protein [Bacillus sp. (in: firmicutes)]
MGEIKKRLKKIEYHQRLLLEMIQTQNFPVYRLIVKNDLSEEEVEELFKLCDDLTIQYEQQKEEGFVYFMPLLTQFINLVNKKLDPEETIHAFLEQKMYVTLMEVLKKTLTIAQK